MMETIAIVPCLNEEKFISDIVIRVRKYVDRVVVADDCSIDKTVYLAQQAGAKVVQGSQRRGYGINIRLGIDAALANGNPGIFVLLDGDGQHNPDEIPNLIKPIIMGVADMVVGNRILRLKMPKYRRFGNAILNWIVNIGAKPRMPDSTCGFRAFRSDVLKKIKLTENHFGLALEMVIKVRAHGLRIASVPISCIYHDDINDNSSMNPLPMGLLLAWVALKWRIKTELFRRIDK